MTKFIYGRKPTMVAYGVAMLEGCPTPFIGFSVNAVEAPKKSVGADGSEATIKAIEDAGGVVVFLDSPEAAVQFSDNMVTLIEYGMTTPWSEKEVRGTIQ